MVRSMALRLVACSCAFALLSACATFEERLCRGDAFFCDEGWEKGLAKLSSERLFALDLKYHEVSHGGHSTIEEELGRRGTEAMHVVLDPSNYRSWSSGEYNALISNLNQIRASSELDYCVPPQKGNVLRFLEAQGEKANPGGYVNEWVDDLKSLCEIK